MANETNDKETVHNNYKQFHINRATLKVRETEK